MLQRLRILVIAAALALNVVLVVQRRHRPGVAVLCVVEADLDHDAALAGLGDEIFQAREKLRIPFVEVKQIAAERISRLLTSRPWQESG